LEHKGRALTLVALLPTTLILVAHAATDVDVAIAIDLGELGVVTHACARFPALGPLADVKVAVANRHRVTM
jgi:hypothetical protein